MPKIFWLTFTILTSKLKCTIYFSSPETKILKIWKEQIAKAKELYEEAKTASNSRFYYTSGVVRGQFSTSNDLDEDGSNAFLTAESSGCRRGSSYRGSRISSVAHSHSGSVDLMEAAGFK